MRYGYRDVSLMSFFSSQSVNWFSLHREAVSFNTHTRTRDAPGTPRSRRHSEVLSSPRCRCLDTARLAFGRVQPWDVLQGALNDIERRQRQLAEIKSAITAHRSGPPLILVTHGSVVTDLTGLNIPMGAFVVLRRAGDGGHAVVGQLYVE